MRFSLENINKVRKADLKIDGLTIIAGENDTGKSTVGKMLFSTIRAVSDLNSTVEQSLDKSLTNYIASIYKRSADFRLRSPLGNDTALFPSSSIRFKQALILANERGELKKFLNDRLEVLKGSEDLSPREKALIQQDFENITILLENKDNSAAELKTQIQFMIESEFFNKVCSNGTEDSFVRFSAERNDSDEVDLEFHIRDENVSSVFTSLSRSFSLNLQDATYVESPLYIHMMDAIMRSSFFRETNRSRLLPALMVPIHIKDFAEKIDSIKFLSRRSSENILSRFDNPISGHFEFDPRKRNLVFVKDGVAYSPINVASGIKAFGVIQMLLEAGAISPEKILIWDEPENHLHPKWQIQFAKIIVQLVESGIPIIISTHSPYFIQAIRYYSARYGVEAFVNYYLAEEKEGLSEITNVTNDLNQIFTKLSAPLNEVMNIGKAREEYETK